MGRNTRSKKKKNTTTKKQVVPTIDQKATTTKGKKRILPPIMAMFAIAMALVVIFISKKEEKPDINGFNLLVITLDTLRADHVGAYGYTGAKTPNLDRLAREGVLFENCYSPVPLTLPSHSSIFTGRYPVSHGVRGNGSYMLPEAEITLAEKLNEAGFHTFGVISSFVLLSKFGISQGFEQFDDSLNSHKMYNNYTTEIPATDVYGKFLQWFEKNHQKRFFSWVHLYDPHAPYKAPPRYRKQFKNDSIGRYDAEIAFTDEGVGKIIERLKEKNLLKNTLVVITSDHGEAFGEHQEQQHGFFCYQEVVTVPLIFYNPQLFKKKGLRIKNRVNLVDIMPTLLELFKLPVPSSVQGESFLAMLKGKKEEKIRNFYFESMHGKDEMNWAPLMGIVHDQYKYISLPEPELYDLDNDADEKENLFWKNNRLAKDLDKKLKDLVSLYGQTSHSADARRNLSDGDKSRLKSLGYISSFSEKTSQNQDPKKGIILDNKIKSIFAVIMKGEYAEAETQLNQLVSEYSQIKLSTFYDLRHQLYMKQGDTAKATDVLKEAIKEFPKIERFYILYAFKIHEAGKIKETESVCKQLLVLNPRFTRAYILLAEIEEKRKNTDKAIEFYKKALQIEPGNISLKLKYAELLIGKKEYKTALAIYDDLMERKEVSNNPGLLFNVALFNTKHGTLDKAEKLLKRATTIAPSGQYFFSYSMVLAQNKKNSQALSNMRIALDKYTPGLSQRQLRIAKQAIEKWSR